MDVFRSIHEAIVRGKTKDLETAEKPLRNSEKDVETLGVYAGGKLLRSVKTSRGGPDMPKRQPCPQCNSWGKRLNKTANGANYRCRTHGSFFVRR